MLRLAALLYVMPGLLGKQQHAESKDAFESEEEIDDDPAMSGGTLQCFYLMARGGDRFQELLLCSVPSTPIPESNLAK